MPPSFSSQTLCKFVFLSNLLFCLILELQSELCCLFDRSASSGPRNARVHRGMLENGRKKCYKDECSINGLNVHVVCKMWMKGRNPVPIDLPQHAMMTDRVRYFWLQPFRAAASGCSSCNYVIHISLPACTMSRKGANNWNAPDCNAPPG